MLVAVSVDPATIVIPADLLPADGRFGSGPSKVRPEQLDALVAAGDTVLGTSHRQPPVKNLVGSVRSGLSELFSLPDGWEIVLGNGGSTVFWDVATFGLIANRSQHLVFGEFSSKFAEAAAAAPHLGEPTVIKSDTGSHPVAVAEDGIDLYALTHNETSTGVAMELRRPAGTSADTALVAVDATSAAGGLRWDPSEVDVYYFAPQKCFASDGGLWLAACSPAALERIQLDRRERPLASGVARPADRARQLGPEPDLQHPGARHARACSTRRCVGCSTTAAWTSLRGAAPSRPPSCTGGPSRGTGRRPFVTDPSKRSNVVGTIDLDDSIDATTVNQVLAANGVLDTFAYRKLGRNQLRIAMFPAIDPSDVEALTRSIDHVVAALT